jgi:D-3-phosphoglycerate dehydrogenase
VTLHAPITPETRHMIKAAHLARLRDGAVFVNVARSWLVDQEALLVELRKNRFWAALDVFDQEPLLDARHPLLTMDNVVCTPHIGYVTREEWDLQFADVFDQVNAFDRGAPVNVVNPEALTR